VVNGDNFECSRILQDCGMRTVGDIHELGRLAKSTENVTGLECRFYEIPSVLKMRGRLID